MLLGIRALEVGAFEVRIIQIDADPGECVDDALRPFRLVALGIGVFDPQHEGSTQTASERPVEQRSTRTAHVEVAGG